jgi:multidrug resistance efflux pump
MKGVKPIPTPARLRWREFRIRVIPGLVYASVLAASAWIWVRHVTPPQLVGEVEIVRTQVNSTRAGRLADLKVEQFQPVKAGQMLGQVVTTDPEVLSGTLAVIRAELELIRAQADPLLTRERAGVDFERWRLDWMEQRVELAASRVRLQYAEAEANRITQLYESKTGIVSKDEYDQILNNRDILRKEIAERETLVAETQAAMNQFRLADLQKTAASTVTNTPTSDPFQASLALQESKLRLTEAELKPLPLIAPVDGVISAVYRRSGENVAPGDPILTITARQSRRILAFVIPPVRREPTVGMSMEVVKRTGRRETALAQVTHVGSFMDAVPTSLLAPVNLRTIGLDNRPDNAAAGAVQIGLPVVLTLPPELDLRPGELVDLRWVPEG